MMKHRVNGMYSTIKTKAETKLNYKNNTQTKLEQN